MAVQTEGEGGMVVSEETVGELVVLSGSEWGRRDKRVLRWVA
jgi:hypothetical protein